MTLTIQPKATLVVERRKGPVFLQTATAIRGAQGPGGPAGASEVAGTSTTSLAIGTGTKTFTIVESDRGWSVGVRLRAASAANPTTKWVEGIITAYSGTTLELSADLFLGSGTVADWNINITGAAGDMAKSVYDPSNNATDIFAALALKAPLANPTFTTQIKVKAGTNGFIVGTDYLDNFFIQLGSLAGFGTAGKVFLLDAAGNMGLWGLPASGKRIYISSNMNTDALTELIHLNQSALAGASTQSLLKLSDANTVDRFLLKCVASSTEVFTVNSQGIVKVVGRFYLGTYTVATKPSASPAAGLIYISDESGGAVIAFSDNTNWRRCTDRAVVS